MNDLWNIAYVVMPLVVLGMGLLAVRLHKWDLDRHKRPRN